MSVRVEKGKNSQPAVTRSEQAVVGTNTGLPVNASFGSLHEHMCNLQFTEGAINA